MRENSSGNQIQEKLIASYRARRFLPKLLDDDNLPLQEIEATYVNLMLIKKEDEKQKDKGVKREEKPYGSYEDINANKTSIDLDAIFDESNKILIYGRAGIGKTTLCNYISYKWAKEEQGLWQDKFDYVFWLPLRRLNDKWKKVYPTKVGDYSLECFIKIYCLDQD
ncbi:MAG: hypothetical protein K0R73_1266, partial [Candidatus Midichloriaceae bacterium]|nr:hypothetical protein [Candidatus Midichloriaceae bacterium]